MPVNLDLSAEELRVIVRALDARELPLRERAHAMHVAGDLPARDAIDAELEVALELLKKLAPHAAPMPTRPETQNGGN